LRLRPGLEILRTGPRTFLLLDPRTGTQFALGAEERYLVHLLETNRSLEDLPRAYQERFGRPLSRRHVEEFIQQLRQLNLLVDSPAAEDGPVAARAPIPAPSPVLPFTPGDPGARLNRFFDVLALWFGWLFHPIWIAPIVVMVILAINAVVRNWAHCQQSLALPTKYFPTLILIPLLALQTVLLLNLPHALLIGAACRRFGGRIRSFSLRLYNDLIPQLFCDTGDSGLWMSQRGRWTMATLSIWCYLGIGSGMTLLWATSRPGSPAAAFWIWMVPPCLLGVFCYCNPFFKFGGYRILSYLVDEPNLCDRAVAETLAWWWWRRSPEALTDKERYWFRWYGTGYFLFRLLFDGFVLYTIGSWMTRKFQGAGAVAFVALFLWWYRAGIGRILMSSSTLAWLARHGGAWWFRWPLRVVLAAAVVGIGFLPYNYEIVGECRLVPQAQHGVRAQITDEILRVHVTEGDHVAPGAVLFTLSGRGVREAYLASQADLDRAHAQLDLLRTGHRPEDIKIAAQKVELWQVRVRYYDDQLRREERLLRTNAASRQQYDKYKESLDSSQEQLIAALENLSKLKQGYREEEIRAAEAAVKHQEERLKYYEEKMALIQVTTPIGGLVVTANMEEKLGQQAKAGDLLAVVQDTSRLRVEVAADDAAAEVVKAGMRVNVRLHALYGRLLTGRVQQVARMAEQDRMIGVAPVRTDPESVREELMNTRDRSSNYHVRVDVELDPDQDLPELSPEMTGYARIIVTEDDVLWRSLARPIVRLLRTTVWSWLP
jgi:multidrug efflux pump subunit AcrA (membrane-fusion protein)